MESYEIICFLRLWRILDGPARLRHHTSNTLRIQYKDEDGGYVNLNVHNTDNFQEMFVRARSVDEGIYRKILLRVSELDSPAVFRICDLCLKTKHYVVLNYASFILLLNVYISRVILDFRSTLCDKIIHNDDTK